MSVGSYVAGEIILLSENIKNNVDLFKEATKDFFGAIIEYHGGVWDLDFEINGEKIFHISPYDKSQEEVTNLINEKFSFILDNDERILEEIKKIKDNKIGIEINYNLMGIPSIKIMKELYEKYNEVFEFKAFRDTEHEYFTLYKFEEGEMESCYSEDTYYMEEGYIEDIEVVGKYAKLYFHCPYGIEEIQHKIDHAKKLINSLNIEDLDCDEEELSWRETQLELYCACLNKENKKKFFHVIKEIVEMIDCTREELSCHLNFGSARHCYLETYFVEDNKVKVRHIR